MATYLKKASPAAAADVRLLQDTVRSILDEIRAEGEPAVRRYSKKFDDWDPETFRVGPEAIAAAQAAVSDELAKAIAFSKSNIENFARLQLQSMQEFEVETLPGVFLGQRHIPVAAAGAYVPGGQYPLIASALMSISTAKTAGVERVIACAPPQRGGGIFPESLYAMHLAGADEIYCIGGVQALGLMAYGIDGVEPVDFLVGPGNAYVAEAKRQLFGEVGIDLLAGPTEILIIIDESADAELVAADLLGQAEHGLTSPVILISTSEAAAQNVVNHLHHQLEALPTAETAGGAWTKLGEVILVDSPAEAAAIADEYAPEHLEVHTSNNAYYFDHLRAYGTLCVGEEASIVFSDKSIGTNHILPTARAARYTGGLWVGKFLKTVTFQRCTPQGALSIAPSSALISEAESQAAHAASSHMRARKYGSE
jgi:sulfopropanediol 3-dehydrogenase